MNRSIRAVEEYFDEKNRIYLEPIAQRVQSVMDPWFTWTMETADSWFVKPFDRRRRNKPNEGEEEDGIVMTTAAVVQKDETDQNDKRISDVDMSCISTSIDVTGDRNDSIPGMKSVEI